MPRVGFAYSPQGVSRTLVFRGSFGIFHAVTPPVFFNAATKAFREPPANLSVTLPTSEATVYRQFLSAGIDLNEYALSELPVFSKEEIVRVLDGDAYLGAAPWLASPDFRNPRSLKYTLALEYGVTDRMVAGLQWMLYRTTRLHGLRDYNLPGAYLRPDDPARIPYYDTGNRPAPLLGPVTVAESLGRATYDGVTANWKYSGDRVELVAHYNLFTRLFERCQRRVFLAAAVHGPCSPRRRVRPVKPGPAPSVDGPCRRRIAGGFHVVGDSASFERTSSQSCSRNRLERGSVCIRAGAAGAGQILRAQHVP